MTHIEEFILLTQFNSCSYSIRWYTFIKVCYSAGNHNITPSPIVDMLLQPSRFFALPYVLFFLLFYFTNMSFLCNISEVGHISKATVCRAVRKVWLALKRALHIFVVFPGYKPTSDNKGLVLRIAGGRCRNQLKSVFYILPHNTSKHRVNYFHNLHGALTSDRHW